MSQRVPWRGTYEREDGFTLVELVISITIIGVIFVSVAMALATTSRSTQSASAQLNVAQWQTRLSYRLASDIQSSVANGGVVTTSAGSTMGCGSVDTVLWLRSSDEATGTPVLGEVEYKRTSNSELIRTACKMSGVSVVKTTTVIAQDVTAALATIKTKTAGGLTLTSSVDLKVAVVKKGIASTFTASGTPRNTGAAVTAATTTVAPPTPGTASCTVLPSDVSWSTTTYAGRTPAAVVKIGRITGRLKAPVTVAVKTSGACDPPFIVQRAFATVPATGNTFFTPSPGYWQLAANPAGSTTTWQGIISAADGIWQETVRTTPNWAPMVINDVNPPTDPLNDANIGTPDPNGTAASRFVTAACRLDTMTVASPVTINYRTKQPLVPVPVTVEGPANNYCDGALVTFSQGFTPANTLIATLTGGPTTWTGSIPETAGVWSITTDGEPVISSKAFEGDPANPDNESNPAAGFVGVATTNTCKVTGISVSPALQIKNNNLKNDVTFTVTTDTTRGPCANLRLNLSGASNQMSGPLTGGPTTWTVQVKKNDGVWAAGQLNVGVRFNTSVCCANAADQAFTVEP